jgi:hypothetical protein
MSLTTCVEDKKMGEKLPDELYGKTQIGQILIAGGVIKGSNPADSIEKIAAEQQKQPPGEKRKFLGEMLVDAGLCSKADIDAGLEVQKNVRDELFRIKQEKGSYPDAASVDKLIGGAYEKYEINHPDYHRDGPKDAAKDAPRDKTDGLIEGQLPITPLFKDRKVIEADSTGAGKAETLSEIKFAQLTDPGFEIHRPLAEPEGDRQERQVK